MSVGGLTRGGDATDEVFMVVKNYKGPGRDASESYNQAGIFRLQALYKRRTRRPAARCATWVSSRVSPSGRKGPR